MSKNETILKWGAIVDFNRKLLLRWGSIAMASLILLQGCLSQSSETAISAEFKSESTGSSEFTNACGEKIATHVLDKEILSVTLDRHFVFKNVPAKSDEKTSQSLQSGLLNNPGDVSTIRGLAYKALCRENAEGALSLIKLDTSAAFNEGESLLIQSAAYYLRGDNDLGWSLLLKSALDPRTEFLAHFNMAKISLSLGNTNQSIQESRILLNLDKNFYLSYMMLGHSYFRQKKYGESADAFRQILKYDSQQYNARYNLGLVLHLGLRNIELAQVEFKKIIDSKYATEILKLEASSAYSNAQREQHGREHLATTGVF